MATPECSGEEARGAPPPQRPFVLMIAPGPFFVDRGFGVLVYEQARALMRRGVRVEVVCYHSGRDLADVPIHRAPPWPGYDAFSIGPSLARLPLWVLLLYKTLEVMRRVRPDILHGHLHEGALIASIVSRLADVPWVFDFQGSLSLEMAEKDFVRPGSAPFRMVGLAERWIDRLAPRILVKSVVMERDLEERFGVDASKILRVMDGADPDAFSPRPGDPELRRRLGIDPDATVIGYLGLLTEQQGIERLLRAVPEVLAEQPKSHLLVIGYPVEYWAQLARDLGIERRVTFTGRVDHFVAPDYLALADLTVAPKISRTEGNAKIYNYMSMSLPVVSMDNSGNREILGDDGYYVQGERPEELAQVIIDALEARDEWSARGKRLRARLEEQFTWQAVASRLVAAYREVAPRQFKSLAD